MQAKSFPELYESFWQIIKPQRRLWEAVNWQQSQREMGWLGAQDLWLVPEVRAVLWIEWALTEFDVNWVVNVTIWLNCRIPSCYLRIPKNQRLSMKKNVISKLMVYLNLKLCIFHILNTDWILCISPFYISKLIHTDTKFHGTEAKEEFSWKLTWDS